MICTYIIGLTHSTVYRGNNILHGTLGSCLHTLTGLGVDIKGVLKSVGVDGKPSSCSICTSVGIWYHKSQWIVGVLSNNYTCRGQTLNSPLDPAPLS